MSTRVSPDTESIDEQATMRPLTAARLVAEHELTTYVRSKGLWIETVLMVVGVFALAILPTVLGGGKTAVAVVGSDASTIGMVANADDFEVRRVADVEAAEALVRDEEVDAALVPDASGESPSGVRVVALSDPPIDVLGALNTAPPVDLLEPAETSEGARYLVMLTFALLFMMFGIGGTAIAQRVVTEKQTRVVEILVTAISPRSMLAGRIAAHALMAFAQVSLLAVTAPIAIRLGGQSDLLAAIAPALAWFVPFFILGFILLSSIWAVTGSLISRQEDLGKVMAPVMMLVMIPYFGVLSFSDNDTVMTILSYVPFSAPVAMPVRLFAGEAQVYEPILALVILAATVIGSVTLASRFYTGSLLQMGAKVKLSQAWNGLK